VKTQQHGQRAVVREQFDIYFKTTGSSDRDLRGILPEGSLEELGRMEQHEDRPDEVTRARIVADIISSMTERQLLLTHRKLTGIELGSITDLI
jgi:dGTP triphosphohydrolase